mmetsp:Transcript_5694/g.8027  ORF Transcript_5694/g.8027 Transcript_5694/m.8027 type:complete len:215 (-) Transcript_5694:2680-3324(-)
MNRRNSCFVQQHITWLKREPPQIICASLSKHPKILQIVDNLRTVQVITSKYHGTTSPFYPERDAWNRVQGVCELKDSTLELQLLPDNRWSVSMTVPEQRWTQSRQSGVLSNETLVNRWRRDDSNTRPGHDLLKRSRVVVRVTMCDDDGHDHLWPDALPFQRCRRVWRWINHDAAPINPQHISRHRTILIKSVRVSEDSDTKRRRMKRWCSHGLG